MSLQKLESAGGGGSATGLKSVNLPIDYESLYLDNVAVVFEKLDPTISGSDANASAHIFEQERNVRGNNYRPESWVTLTSSVSQKSRPRKSSKKKGQGDQGAPSKAKSKYNLNTTGAILTTNALFASTETKASSYKPTKPAASGRKCVVDLKEGNPVVYSLENDHTAKSEACEAFRLLREEETLLERREKQKRRRLEVEKRHEEDSLQKLKKCLKDQEKDNRERAYEALRTKEIAVLHRLNDLSRQKMAERKHLQDREVKKRASAQSKRLALVEEDAARIQKEIAKHVRPVARKEMTVLQTIEGELKKEKLLLSNTIEKCKENHARILLKENTRPCASQRTPFTKNVRNSYPSSTERWERAKLMAGRRKTQSEQDRLENEMEKRKRLEARLEMTVAAKKKLMASLKSMNDHKCAPLIAPVGAAAVDPPKPSGASTSNAMRDAVRKRKELENRMALETRRRVELERKVAEAKAAKQSLVRKSASLTRKTASPPLPTPAYTLEESIVKKTLRTKIQREGVRQRKDTPLVFRNVTQRDDRQNRAKNTHGQTIGTSKVAADRWARVKAEALERQRVANVKQEMKKKQHELSLKIREESLRRRALEEQLESTQKSNDECKKKMLTSPLVVFNGVQKKRGKPEGVKKGTRSAMTPAVPSSDPSSSIPPIITQAASAAMDAGPSISKRIFEEGDDDDSQVRSDGILEESSAAIDESSAAIDQNSAVDGTSYDTSLDSEYEPFGGWKELQDVLAAYYPDRIGGATVEGGKSSTHVKKSFSVKTPPSIKRLKRLGSAESRLLQTTFAQTPEIEVFGGVSPVRQKESLDAEGCVQSNDFPMIEVAAFGHDMVDRIALPEDVVLTGDVDATMTPPVPLQETMDEVPENVGEVPKNADEVPEHVEGAIDRAEEQVGKWPLPSLAAWATAETYDANDTSVNVGEAGACVRGEKQI